MISLKTKDLMENVWQKQPQQVPIDKLQVDHLVEASLHSMAELRIQVHAGSHLLVQKVKLP